MIRNRTLSGECRRIADQLIDLATIENGLFWLTMNLVGSRIQFGRSQSLYAGTSGITLFLLEAARVLEEKQYWDTIKLAADSLGQADHLSGHSAFLTGDIGALFPLLRAPSMIGEDHFDILEGTLLRATSNPEGITEFINGRCGSILGLAHLSNVFDCEKVILVVDELLGCVIDQICINAAGIAFDRSKDAIQPLCGFAHGAAGIGFVFAEISRYFSNPSYAWLANEVFRQEKEWYDAQSNTWPDLRKHMFSDQDRQNYRQAFESDNREFFIRPSKMTAWCHGAPGIGLTRLRAWQLLGKEEYFRDFERAVQKVRENDLTYNPRRTFTLCHGSCGNAELLLEGYRVTGRKEYLEDAYRIAEFAIRQKEELGVYLSGYAQAGMQEDLSLFMGTAGIGYFFLRLLDPSVPSILLPTIDAPPVKVDPKYKNINISLPELKRRVCSRAYGRTLVAMGGNLPSFSEHADDHLQVELQTVERAAGVSESAAVKDALEYEKAVRELDHSIESFALLHAEMLFGRYEGPLTDEVVLTLSNRVRLVTTRWNWLSDDLVQELQKAPSEVFVLLQALPEKVKEIRLSPFAFTVLELFREPVRLDDAWLLCKSQIEMEDEKEASEAHAFFIDQIRQAVEARVLVEVKTDGH